MFSWSPVLLVLYILYILILYQVCIFFPFVACCFAQMKASLTIQKLFGFMASHYWWLFLACAIGVPSTTGQCAKGDREKRPVPNKMFRSIKAEGAIQERRVSRGGRRLRVDSILETPRNLCAHEFPDVLHRVKPEGTSTGKGKWMWVPTCNQEALCNRYPLMKVKSVFSSGISLDILTTLQGRSGAQEKLANTKQIQR